MVLKIKHFGSVIFLIEILFASGCIHYSFTGVSTSAATISIDQFFNNSDLAPANLGASFTNRLKDYYIQNSSLKIVQESGELSLEGVISDYRLNPIAPTANSTNSSPSQRPSPPIVNSLGPTAVGHLSTSVPGKIVAEKPPRC
jgi:hypothetical protein